MDISDKMGSVFFPGRLRAQVIAWKRRLTADLARQYGEKGLPSQADFDREQARLFEDGLKMSSLLDRGIEMLSVVNSLTQGRADFLADSSHKLVSHCGYFDRLTSCGSVRVEPALGIGPDEETSCPVCHKKLRLTIYPILESKL